MRAGEYGGNAMGSRRGGGGGDRTWYGKELVRIPFQVETKCSTIILIFVSHQRLHQMVTLKDASPLLGGKDFSFGSCMSSPVCFLPLCFNFSHNADDPL